MGISDKLMVPLTAAYFIASLVFFGLSTTANPEDTSTSPDSNNTSTTCGKSNFDLYAADWAAMMTLLTCQITLTTIGWETEAKKHSKRKDISLEGLDYESFPYRFIFYFLWSATWIPAVVAMAGFLTLSSNAKNILLYLSNLFSCAVSVFLAMKIRVDLSIAKRNESTHATEICKFRTSVELKVKKTANDNYLE
jgi:hypothetical protein